MAARYNCLQIMTTDYPRRRPELSE